MSGIAFGSSSGGTSDITIDTPSGSATSSSGVLNFTGSGVSISASGNTVDFSVSSSGLGFSDVSTDQTISSNAGYFVTSGVTLTLPASPSQGDSIVIACDTASPVTLQLPAGQYIRLSNVLTSAGGTCSSLNQGDSLVMYYRSASSTWWAFSTQLTWDLN